MKKINFKKFNNKNIAIVIAVLAVLIIILAVIQQTKFSKQGEVIGQVNGKDIYDMEVKKHISRLYNLPMNFNLNVLPNEQKEILIKQIYTEQLLVKNARNSGIASNPEIKEQIEEAKNKILKESFLEQIASNASTREKIEALYNEKAEELKKEVEGKKEIRAKHILVKTREEANEIILSLQNKSFEDLAKEKSIDTISARNGGDVGYFTKGKMIKEFENRAFSMKIGSVSQPFKTQFGWHIVKVVDKRDAQVPTLDEMFESLKREVGAKAINDYVTNLSEQINIDLIKQEEKQEEKEEVKEVSSN